MASPTPQQTHWDQTYSRREARQVSWYEAAPDTSLALIEAAIVDIGGGTSRLPAHLLHAVYRDVTVMDISRTALERAKLALGDATSRVSWISGDVRAHEFPRRYELWHCSGLPVSRYREDGLRGVLGPDFGLVSAQTVDHHTPSGVTQQFLYALWRRGPR